MRWKLLGLALLVALGICVEAAPAWANSIQPMCTTIQGGPSPCVNGWYTTPVQLQWQVTPFTTDQSGCVGPPPFTRDTKQTVECDANWPSPPDIQYPYQVRVELSSPTATASLARPPDSNGWYNHPVDLSMSGGAFSGIASCSAPAYGGPSGANVTAVGSCTDNAGKTATAGVSFKYDDTPPTITGATPARAPDADGYYTHPVRFTFNGSDALSGIGSCDTVTYRGPSSGSVIGGCDDLAGNYASISVPVRYRVDTPRASVARTSSSLVLRWKSVKHATYYNVQVYRAGKKVLSAWPTHTSLTLPRSWKFAGHRFRLRKGHYRWYVWPGFGSRRQARYGGKWVSSSFRLTKTV